MATNKKKKEKLVVDSVDKAIKSYMDENCSPEDYKKLIFKLEGGLVKAVLHKDLSVVEFAKADKILEEFENRKKNPEK
jgi:hypothetical protein